MGDLGALSTYAIAIGIGIIAFFAIAYYFYRWIFSINRQLWNQRQQINILLKIAEKLGVDSNDSELMTIRYENNNRDQ